MHGDPCGGAIDLTQIVGTLVLTFHTSWEIIHVGVPQERLRVHALAAVTGRVLASGGGPHE